MMGLVMLLKATFSASNTFNYFVKDFEKIPLPIFAQDEGHFS